MLGNLRQKIRSRSSRWMQLRPVAFRLYTMMEMGGKQYMDDGECLYWQGHCK